MRTSQDYREKLYTMRPNIYIGGECIPREDSRLEPGIKVLSLTFDTACNNLEEELYVARSHLNGEKINRFCHIHQSADDLLLKQKMIRKYCHKVGRCIQRCMGVDALNAISAVSYRVDQEKGTNYHQRFLKYLEMFQKNDLVGNAAQTDVKGDRSLRPHRQADPDSYLRIVKQNKDGIIVRGAKAHNSIAPYTDEIIAFPTRALTPEEKDWAVAFAVPADAPGVSLITVVHNQRRRKEFAAPIAEYGTTHSITVFEDVFVPWERVFLCGETEFAGQLATLFATYHRHSYTGCKPAMTDVLMGAAALVSEYNGIANSSHVRDKISEMITVAELVYGAGIASAHTGKKSPSGTFIPDVIYCNVGRYHAGVNIYHEFEVVADLAGGLVATLPQEEEFINPDTSKYLDKYIQRKEGVSPENQHRLYRLIENITCSAPAAASLVSGIHGGGSPIMEKIAIMFNYDLKERINIVKELAGIED